MNAGTANTRTIVEWALAHDGNLSLYRNVENEPGWVEPGDDWQGSAPGFHGGEIHLVAQDDTHGCLYAETTDDLDAADYLVGSAGLSAYQDTTSAVRAIRDLLDLVFGDVWPDNYAQCDGWRLG